MNLKLFYCFFLLCFFVVNVQAQQAVVTSLDGKLIVNLSVNNGTPTYSVSCKGKLFLEQSPIGLKTNVGDFIIGLELKEKQVQNKIDETYELPSDGYTFPCLFKINNNGWVLISETGVDSGYYASKLICHDKGLYTPLVFQWKAKTTAMVHRIPELDFLAKHLGERLLLKKHWNLSLQRLFLLI